MNIFFKSIFFSSLTFLTVNILNYLFSFLNNNFLFFASYLSFLFGGFLNYIFYLKIIYKTHLKSKRIFLIYWSFLPFMSLLHSSIYKFIFITFKNIPNYYLAFYSTSIAVIICYPISFIFMYYLGNYARKLKK